jgi:PAS domain S-box-containing protein
MDRVQKLEKFGDRFYNSVTLVDVSKDSQPIIYVNEAFEKLTGYPRHEILGKNCRFLQGPGTSRKTTRNVREAVAKGQPFFCDLLNYKKSGEVFLNRLCLLPIFDDESSFYIGMQIQTPDVTSSSFGPSSIFCLDERKNERLCDVVNNSLMKIQTILSLFDPGPHLEPILEESFQAIVDLVRTIHRL